MFEENGINVISANSDGVTTRFHKSKLELKNELVKQWQQLTNFEIPDWTITNLIELEKILNLNLSNS
jgi:hypothetical protein